MPNTAPQITINLQLTMDGDACADILTALQKLAPATRTTSAKFDRIWTEALNEEDPEPIIEKPHIVGHFTTPAVPLPGYKQTCFRETEDYKVRIICFKHQVDISWAGLYLLKRANRLCAPSSKEDMLRERIHAMLLHTKQAGEKNEQIVRQFLRSMEEHGLKPGDAHRIHRGEKEGPSRKEKSLEIRPALDLSNDPDADLAPILSGITDTSPDPNCGKIDGTLEG